MPASSPTRPGKVTTAILLLYVALGLGLLRAVMSMPASAQMQGYREAVVSLVVLLIIVGAQLLFIFMLGQGRNWARIIYLALFVLGVAAMIFALFSGAALGGGALLDALQTLLQLVALVLLFTPEASLWFRERKAARARG